MKSILYAFVAFFSLSFFIPSLSSCKTKIRETVYLSDSLTAYCDFKPGSYWIYRDSVSHELDSVYVHYRNSNMDWHRFDDIATESIRILYMQNNNDTRNTLWYKNDMYVCLHGEKVIFATENSPVLDASNIPTFDLLKTHYPTLEVAETTYKNVIAFKDVEETERNYRYKICYYAKNIGLVKMQYSNGRIMELVRYNVIQ